MRLCFIVGGHILNFVESLNYSQLLYYTQAGKINIVFKIFPSNRKKTKNL